MSKNTFLFRDEYRPDEMENRIHAEHFRTSDEELVTEVLEDAGLSFSHLLENSPEEFLADIQANVSDEIYEDFLSGMFEKYGMKGDKFNIQFYNANDTDYQQLLQTAEAKVNNLSEKDNSILPVVADLDRIQTNSERKTIDLKFDIVDHQEIVDLDGAEAVFDADEGRVDIEEAGMESVEAVYKDNKYSVEVRLYCESDLVMVSRSRGREKIRKSLKAMVLSWGENNDE